MSWNLESFERSAYSRNREDAARMLLALLGGIDRAYGDLGTGFEGLSAQGLTREGSAEHLVVRVCAAITSLLSDPELQLSDPALRQILVWHRWLATLFSATPFVNTDHILRSLNLNVDDQQGLVISDRQIAKFSVLYSPESNLPLDMDALHAKSPLLAVSLGLALISPRFLGSRAAHLKREVLLGWLPEKLEQLEEFGELPLAILHDVYMHCSYADRPDRHRIKAAIGVQLRRMFEREGIRPAVAPARIQLGKKPVLLVVLEWFSKGHSIYRTHSRSLEAARERFHTVGVGFAHAVDEVTRRVFDQFVEIDPARSLPDLMRDVAAIASTHDAQVLYMPSVGMFPLTMFLCNLRIAPMQVMALGHPATTHSPEIDCVVVEEDYVGDPNCFAEELLRLPSDGMPYRPSQLVEGIHPRYKPKLQDATVDIVVAATTMKLNPQFLEACAEIMRRTRQPVHFHFLVGQAIGLIYPAVQRVVREYLGSHATVYRHQPYEEYMRVIADADMFLNPFPFGNTNGIIDTVSAGLVGVCKTGREVFEHIDEGLFNRLGFPKWLIAHSVSGYVNAAVSLIESHHERMQLRLALTGPEAVNKIFEGRPEIMGEMLLRRLLARCEETAAAELMDVLGA
ncbi:MAG: peptide transporter [Patescibacteria group bacterium]|nr:peptide transporter [Patescibacteria group bacterium]